MLLPLLPTTTVIVQHIYEIRYSTAIKIVQIPATASDLDLKNCGSLIKLLHLKNALFLLFLISLLFFRRHEISKLVFSFVFLLS